MPSRSVHPEYSSSQAGRGMSSHHDSEGRLKGFDDDDDDIPIQAMSKGTIAIPKTSNDDYEEEDYSDLLEELGLTLNHAKLIVLLAKYAKAARTATEKESWIRQIPLLVLMYEGVTAGTLDFDYAPASVLVSQEGHSRRMWLNVTQEGKAAIDDLRERELVNGLKLSSEDFQPVTAFQLSLKGLDILRRIPQSLISEVEQFCKGPKPFDQEYLEVSFDGEEFKLSTDGGFERVSLITDCEDVSYVSSPFLPRALRTSWGRELTSNKHRAHESASGTSNIRDELSEAIHLSHVTVYVGEWIPFGANQIVALNERLGALDRCQGGLFTALIDKNPTDTQFKVDAGLTSVKVIDFDLVRFINFEAEINYPEEEGVVQIENFGMHLNVDGTILYGMKVEAILDRQSDNVSLDHLSRLLVDVHQDSSKIMNDLLSGYQRSLLEMIFMNDSQARGKYNMIIADAIDPKLPAEKYLDRDDNENELKQIIGDIIDAHDVGEDDVLMLGRDGLLMAGPNSKMFEQILLFYLSLLCRELFIRNFFVRTFVLDDTLKKIRALIQSYETDPNNIARIRVSLNQASKDIILLKETLSYLEESLRDMGKPDLPREPRSKHLYEILNCSGMHNDVSMRVLDLGKLVDGLQHELANLSAITDVINTKQLEDVFKGVESNTKFLVDASSANERASASLEVMQVVLAGSFAFDIVDRISGGTLNTDPPEWVITYIKEPLIDPPGIWFAINIGWLLLLCYLLIRLMRYLQAKGAGFLTMRVRLNKPVNVELMETLLSTRDVEVMDAAHEPGVSLKKCFWQEVDKEKWRGPPPKLEVLYDSRYNFVLQLTVTVDKKANPCSEQELVDIFLRDLVEAGAMEEEVAFGAEGASEK